MQLQHYLRMFQRGWWIVALTTLSALAAALAALYVATPLYRVSARFVVSPNIAATNSSNELLYSLDTLRNRSIVSTYAEVLSSARLYAETIAALQIDPASLKQYRLSAIVLPEADVLELTVEGPDPQMTVTLANSVGQRAIDYIQGLYQIYDINFLDPATVPSEPFVPQPVRDTSLATLLGLALGSALTILREQLRLPLEALQRRNIVDRVSTAYKRRYVQRLLEQELERSPLSPLSLGLIQFQGLNDLIETLPQLIVQRLLRRVTTIMRKELRGSDSVGRWADTTFAILLPAAPGAAATQTLQRIQQALSEPIKVDQLNFELDPRIGVGARHGAEPAAAVTQRAEAALEQARLSNSQAMPFSADALNELGFWEHGIEALAGDLNRSAAPSAPPAAAWLANDSPETKVTG